MTDDDMNIKIDRVVLGKGREIIAENARLRSLLRELAAYDRLGEERDYDRCHYCGAWWSVDIEHTADCPVARARAEVGDDE